MVVGMAKITHKFCYRAIKPKRRCVNRPETEESKIPEPDAADALAVALTHANTRETSADRVSL